MAPLPSTPPRLHHRRRHHLLRHLPFLHRSCHLHHPLHRFRRRLRRQSLVAVRVSTPPPRAFPTPARTIRSGAIIMFSPPSRLLMARPSSPTTGSTSNPVARRSSPPMLPPWPSLAVQTIAAAQLCLKGGALGLMAARWGSVVTILNSLSPGTRLICCQEPIA